jgi:hypothetical protein
LEVLEPRALLSTYLVDRLTDSGDGSGLTGDLRYAITQAVDGDTINFGVTGTINLTSALPDLTHNISINGPGANLLTVWGGGYDSYFRYGSFFRIFTVPAGATVSISGLTISGGAASDFGGGINNAGTLTLSNSTVTGNIADPACWHIASGCPWDDLATYGGGIFNGNATGTAILTINNSTISNNQDPGGDGGGIANGGRYSSGALVRGGTVTLNNSTVSGNWAESGGGIYTELGGGTLNVTNSTIASNVARSDGGGIYKSNGTFTISNSTIAENRAGSSFGGIRGIPTLRNSIVAGNTADRYPDLPGTTTSSAFNLIGSNPLLGPLQDNGGPTQTLALLAGSPALNTGDSAQLGVPDQRGVVRSGGVNIGAYQASASAFVLTAPATVTAGTAFDLTVQAVDAFGQVALGYTGTVTFSTTDLDPGVVLRPAYTFTAADQGAHTFAGAVTLITPGDQTLTVTDPLSGISGSATVHL